ncbi:MAG TPA: hypothetical protein VGF17_18005 [Phytomonospora sp.]
MTTEELNRALDEELDRSTPEVSFLPSEILRRGRRRARARFGGYAAGGVAVVAAVAVLLPAAFGGGVDPDTGSFGSRQQDPSEYPIALDPNVEYIWGADESRFDEEEEVNAYITTPLTEELTAAWTAAIADLGIQTRPSFMDEVQRYNEVLTPDQDQSGAYGGWGGDESVVLAERPVYGGQAESEERVITMRVYPAGSFLRGAGTQSKNPNYLLPDVRYLVPGCDPYTQTVSTPEPEQVETTFECVDSDGPDGEQILSVRPSEVIDGRTVRTITYLAVYRPDGSAVLIRERAWNEQSEPSLTDEQLTGLALALPAVPVE